MQVGFMGRPSQAGGTSLSDHLYKNAGKSQCNMKGATHGCEINVCVVGHYVKSISRIANSDLKKGKDDEMQSHSSTGLSF